MPHDRCLAMGSVNDCLDAAILGSRDRDQVGRQILFAQSISVKAIDRIPVAQHEPASLAHRDPMAACYVARHEFESSAIVGCHQLQSTADTKNRQIAFDTDLQQPALSGISLRRQMASPRLLHQIVATRQNHSIQLETRHQLVDVNQCVGNQNG